MRSDFLMKDVVGDCPFATTQKILQGKWAILILHTCDECDNGWIPEKSLVRE